jgi:hypothetical protein|tara:strand:- start:2063 stop:2251 length:189 start_codon:yes stop_codon:yes gene_type:complete
MTDIKSSVLKDIINKKLNKARDGITKILKDKSFKAIEDFKTSFNYELPTQNAPAPEPTEADK